MNLPPFIQNLSPSERRLAAITGCVVVAAALYLALGSGDDTSAAAAPPADLAALETRFENYKRQLDAAPSIIAKYQRLEARLPAADDERQDLAFTNQLATLCTSAGFTAPRIDAAKPEPIQGVDDYELISARIRIEGTYAEMVNLLKLFDNNGLVIREVKLSGTRDRDLMRGEFVLARIAPVPPSVLEAIRRRRQNRT